MMRKRQSHPLLSPRPAAAPSPVSHAQEWDSSTTTYDSTRFRASPREIVQRKLATTSKFNALGALELRRKLGDLQGAFFFSNRARARAPLPGRPNRQLPRPPPSRGFQAFLD